MCSCCQGGRGRGQGGRGGKAMAPVFITGRISLSQAKGFFLAFMQYRDNVVYSNDHHFMDAELNAITPNCIL